MVSNCDIQRRRARISSSSYSSGAGLAVLADAEKGLLAAGKRDGWATTQR